MFALALALTKRGHDVHVAASPNFAAWAARLGLAFTSIGCDTQRWLADNPECLTGNPLRMMQGMRQFFGEQLPVQFDGLIDAAQESSALICAGLALSAPSVAEYLRIPVLGIAYSPCVIPGRDHPPAMVPWQNLPRWINSLLWSMTHRFSEQTFGMPINAGRVRLGLAPVKMFDHLCREMPWLVAADRAILPPSSEWATRVPYANFFFFDDDRSLDFELADWLAAGEPPVFVGFGSMSGEATARIGKLLRQALRESGRRVLLASGWAGLGEGDMPEGWRIVGDVPHGRLFERVAAVIHHGGSGTMATALRAGVPQVVLPLILDQYHHAECLRRADLAPPAGALERISSDSLRVALDAALAMDPGPRQDAALRLSTANGTDLAVAHLEQLAAGRVIPPPFH
ncbi:MAG: glycosyltransferase family 1 protein [Rhodocyclales bacterium]|nr:glycosyltransferase family 1 protein [Rhodocyclales bacterium]